MEVYRAPRPPPPSLLSPSQCMRVAQCWSLCAFLGLALSTFVAATELRARRAAREGEEASHESKSALTK